MQLMLLITLVLFGICIGLTLTIQDFIQLKSQKKALITGLVGQMVILPVIGFMIVLFLKIPTVFVLGIVIIACCPGGPGSNLFTYLLKGCLPVSITLTAVSSVLSVVTLPLVVGIAAEFLLNSQVNISIPVLPMILKLVLLVLLPIVAGMIINRYKPEFAGNVVRPLGRLTVTMLVVVVVCYIYVEADAIKTYFTQLFIALALLVSASMFVGSLISRGVKLSEGERKAVVVEICIQNAAQALAVATMISTNKQYAIPAIFYGLVMYAGIAFYAGINYFTKVPIKRNFM